MASFKYCPDCNNMLYPREDRSNITLLLACRNCEHQENVQDAQDNCVYKNTIQQAIIDHSMAQADLPADPTYPRIKSKTCNRCSLNDVLFYQSRAKGRDASMQLFYVCCTKGCGNRWTVDMSSAA